VNSGYDLIRVKADARLQTADRTSLTNKCLDLAGKRDGDGLLSMPVKINGIATSDLGTGLCGAEKSKLRFLPLPVRAVHEMTTRWASCPLAFFVQCCQ